MLLFEQLAQTLAKKEDASGCGGAEGSVDVDLPSIPMFGVRKRAWMEDYGESPVVPQVCVCVCVCVYMYMSIYIHIYIDMDGGLW